MDKLPLVLTREATPTRAPGAQMLVSPVVIVRTCPATPEVAVIAEGTRFVCATEV